MEYQNGQKSYEIISTYLQGSVNSVYVCREASEEKKYFLWVIENHELAGRLTGVFENEKCPGNAQIFSAGGNYCVILPWERDRRLDQFISAEGTTAEKIRDICREVVFLCMTAELPQSVLYLLIRQNCIQVGKDGKTYFTYGINFSDYAERSEKESAQSCAIYLQGILEKSGYTGWSGYELLMKKNKREGYRSFAELYQDISKGEQLKRTGQLRWKLMNFRKKHGPQVIRLLKIICVVIGITAVVMLAGSIIFGESPFHKLFHNTFLVIGTESLLQ